jgi:peptide/nickel transport system substrate-binding protein
MTVTTRRRFLILAGVWGGASLLAACQAGSSATPSKPQPQSTAEAPRTTAPAASTSGSTQAIVLQGVDANTLDPQFRNATPESNINQHIFSFVNGRDAKTLKPIPEFAQELKLIDDTTWEMKIPSGAKFHDGTAADAEALAWHR